MVMPKIVKDTLMRDGRFSRTSLTMFTAWVFAIYMALYDLWKDGFNYEVFLAFVGVALGAKVTDAWSKKMNKNETPPADPIVN